MDEIKSIAILSPGNMGHAVGRALGQRGYKVFTCLEGRSVRSRSLAEVAGIRDIPNLNSLVSNVDLILSILPPVAALQLARGIATAIKETSSKPVVVDCNAISPSTVYSIAETMGTVKVPFIDAGIIGLAPGMEGNEGPRFYVSGPDTEKMMSLDGCGFKVIDLGKKIGSASGMKMCYAGLTKGTLTLHTAVLLVAERLGLSEELLKEFAFSQTSVLENMKKKVPRLPADSKRWIGEMEEIAKTFSEVGVTSEFHKGAAEIFSLLALTPYASETRESIDINRGLTESVKVYVECLSLGVKT